MRNKNESHKYSFERKKRLHIKRYTKSPIWFSWNPIDKAGWTSSFSSEDAFPYDKIDNDSDSLAIR